MADVFISYSRRDRAYIEELRSALEVYKRSVWVDLRDIPPSADWRDEIHQAIISSDAFICVISPDYVESPICLEELEFARTNNKRLIPVIRRDIPSHQAPPALAALNWIFFRETDDQSAAFGKLLSALDTDLPYVRSGSRLLVRAREWETKGRNASFMLRGKDLAEAEQWLASSGGKQPPPSQEQTQFIVASRHVSTRRQRTTIGALTVGILVTLALSIISTTLYKVTNDQNVTLRGHDIAGKANDALANSHLDQGLALAVAASKQSDDFDTRNALLNGLDSAAYLDAVLVGSQPNSISANFAEVAFSTDGSLIMAADEHNNRILLWNGLTHKLRVTITIPHHDVQADSGLIADDLYGAALSPDGRYVATKNTISGIRLWSASTGTLMATIADSDNTGDNTGDNPLMSGSMKFSPDGKLLAWSECADALCETEQISRWDVERQQLLPALPLTGSSTNGISVELAFSPDSAHLAIGQLNSLAWTKQQLGGRVDIFDLATDTIAQTVILAADRAYGQAGDVLALAYSPDGSQLAIAGDEDGNQDTGQALLWNLAQRRFVGAPMIETDGEVASVVFSRDGQYLITGMRGGTFGLRVWSVQQQVAVTPVLRAHTEALNALAYDPGASEFVSGGEDGQVFLWRQAPYSPFSHLSLDGFDGVGQVAFSPNRALMATADVNGVTLWDARTGAKVRTLKIPASDRNNIDDNVGGLAFSPDSAKLAAGDEQAQVLLWSVASGALLGLPLKGHQIIIPDTLYNFVMDLSFSPDGSKLVTSGLDGQAILWDVKLLAPIKVVTGVTAAEQQAAFSPDGRYLAIAGSQHDIVIWDVASLSVVRTLDSHGVYVRAVAFYPHHNGMLAALDANGAITTWDVTKGRTIGQPLADGRLADSIFSPHLVFNAAGDELIASHDLTITLWNVPQPGRAQRYMRVIVPQYAQLNTTLSPDGRYLATATVGEVEVRYATLTGWRASACAIANRALTQSEWSQLFPDTPYQAAC